MRDKTVPQPIKAMSNMTTHENLDSEALCSCFNTCRPESVNLSSKLKGDVSELDVTFLDYNCTPQID